MYFLKALTYTDTCKLSRTNETTEKLQTTQTDFTPAIFSLDLRR